MSPRHETPRVFASVARFASIAALLCLFGSGCVDELDDTTTGTEDAGGMEDATDVRDDDWDTTVDCPGPSDWGDDDPHESMPDTGHNYDDYDSGVIDCPYDASRYVDADEGVDVGDGKDPDASDSDTDDTDTDDTDTDDADVGAADADDSEADSGDAGPR